MAPSRPVAAGDERAAVAAAEAVPAAVEAAASPPPVPLAAALAPEPERPPLREVVAAEATRPVPPPVPAPVPVVAPPAAAAPPVAVAMRDRSDAAPYPPAPPRRDSHTEEDLRAALALVPEVGIGAYGPAAFQAFVNSAGSGAGVLGEPVWTDPTPLVRTKRDLRQLPLRGGPGSQLKNKEAATLDEQSRKLRVYLTTVAPVGPDGHRPAAGLLAAKLRAETRGQRPEWLRPEAVPALMQLLMHEDVFVRQMLVELLAEIPGPAATRALAQRAAFDLDTGVRAGAAAALRTREAADYRPVLLKALRYPWAPAADHAAEALVALGDRGAVAELVTLLRQPDPALPQPLPGGRLVVQEVVRASHLANCILCHPPSLTGSESPSLGVDPVLTMAFPSTYVSLSRLSSPGGAGSGAPGSSSSFGALVQQAVQRLLSTPGCHHYENAGSTSQGQTTVLTAAPGGASGVGSNAASAPRLTARTAALPAGLAAANGQPRLVRTAGRTLTTLPLVIRGDITYLRQDFSVQQPNGPAPTAGGPAPQTRFDYFLRTRDASPAERAATKLLTTAPSYPQRDAVLFALRGLTGLDGGATTEAWQELFPRAEDDVRAARLCRDLLRANPVQKEVLLAQLREGKGLAHTLALAAAIPSLRGAVQDRAREALADRLTRMTAGTLRDKLADPDAEVQRAAVVACTRKGSKELVPDLIALLDAGEPLTVQLAEAGLHELTGRDFDAPTAWRAWWQRGAKDDGPRTE
jgi:HEAT repeat protein